MENNSNLMRMRDSTLCEEKSVLGPGFLLAQRYLWSAPFFFPGLFFYVYIESPNPRNPEGPTPQAPNPIN